MNIPRIGIDMAATAGQKSGLGFYVSHLVSEMQKLSAENNPVEQELIEITTIKKNLRTYERILWDQAGLPFTALFKQLDLLFVPAFSAPLFPKPVVMTAHDIFGVIHPEQFSVPAKIYWSKLLPHSMKTADHLLCVSEHTKKDIMEHLRVPESRMTVVPLAAGEEFRIITEKEIIQKHLNELNIDFPFVLSVGTIEPRKNFERLIEAFAHSRRGNARLVIVGKKGWNYEGVFERIRKYHLQNAVVFVDYITTEQLVTLYNACLFFIMPSLYEGFGLPALEAMQCGAAVAVSQNTSLPEVVGEAGIVFDPYDVTAIVDRLNTLLNNDRMRKEMRYASLDRAQQFSWKQTAQATLSQLQNIVKH